MGHLAPKLVAEVAESLGEQVGGGVGKFFILLLLLLLGLLLLDLFDPELYHPEGVENAVAVGPVLVDVVGGEDVPGPFGVVPDEVAGGEEQPEAQHEGHQAGGSQDDHVSGVVEGAQLDQDVADHHISRDVLQDEHVFAALPLTLDVPALVVQALRAPRQVVDAAEREQLQQVYVCWRVVDIRQH